MVQPRNLALMAAARRHDNAAHVSVSSSNTQEKILQIQVVSRELDDLPASVREIAQVIGREATLHLLGQLPACRAGKRGKESNRVILYVPKKLGPDHRLVQILGVERAMALVRAFGGEVMQPANCRRIYARYRDEAILKMLRDGARLEMVLSIMRVSKRHVVNLTRAQGGPAPVGRAPV